MGGSLTLYVIIPVKRLDRGKLRLSSVLDETERKELSLCMLRDVLKAVSSARQVKEAVVISPDPTVLDTADAAGLTPIREPTPMDINEAVQHANNFCLDHAASATLVLPADIPLLQPQDISDLVDASEPEPSIVITPSIRQDGTNALIRRPPDIVTTSYDRESYPTHLSYASKRHIHLVVLRSERVMLDLDLPEDLEAFLKHRSDTETNRYLARIRLAERRRQPGGQIV